MIRRLRRRARPGRLGKRLHSGISLTSLMDILPCLLFFVLKSFVAGGEATVPPPGLDLPRSTADSAMTSSLVVAIDKGAILVGGERVTSVSDALAGPTMVIPPLAARLAAERRQQDEIARRRGLAAAPRRVVTIQGDEAIEFRVLQRVMATLDDNGYQDIALAVIKKA